VTSRTFVLLSTFRYKNPYIQRNHVFKSIGLCAKVFALSFRRKHFAHFSERAWLSRDEATQAPFGKGQTLILNLTMVANAGTQEQAAARAIRAGITARSFIFRA